MGLLYGGTGRLTAKNGFPARADGESGALRPHTECMVPIGNAARHLAVHPDGKHVSTASLYLVTLLLAEGSAQIYVDEEAGTMVTAHDFDAAAGALTRTQTLPTLPEGARGSTSECELGPGGKVRRHFPSGLAYILYYSTMQPSMQ